MKRIWLFFLLTLFYAQAEPVIESLSPEQLAEEKEKPCTLIHAWANWCSICVKEMPTLLPLLAQLKDVNVVVVDTSTPESHVDKSRLFLTLISPPGFKTYARTPGEDKAYGQAIDKDCKTARPFSVLYDKGKRKKVWKGRLNRITLAADIRRLCAK